MFTTLDSFDTEYSADSVEWCPAEGFKDLFVCGTYQLVPGEEDNSSGSKSQKIQTRLGKIYLFRVILDGKLQLEQTLETAAVLDMKWAHRHFHGEILLGVVNSIGFLQIFRLSSDCTPEIKLITEIRIRECEDEILALSLDWNTARWIENSTENIQIAVSDSKGAISLYSFDGQKLELCAVKKLHEFEAWITAFDYWSTNVIYSGGDDSKFHRLDSRMGLESTASNKKHGAGVTSIHSNATREFSLATGSYDEILRLWDTRNLRAPISETNLQGGIWRLKWDPHNHKYLLAACMYGGFRGIDCSDESAPQILAEYNEHESIAYGCDWSFLNDTCLSSKILGESPKNIVLVATCSFYDHTLKISSLKLGDA
ncbi:diphthine methyltransferase [Venturia canescens]|uniref:diphthine methyltransferase n=1 Tax=Venturia canescens TaxID=32260 RepID=UPI001C9CD7DC|nr:diphthine methyltransferase [Venturia canescens]